MMASFASLCNVLHFLGKCLSLPFMRFLVVVHVGIGHVLTLTPDIELDLPKGIMGEQKRVSDVVLNVSTAAHIRLVNASTMYEIYPKITMYGTFFNLENEIRGGEK